MRPYKVYIRHEALLTAPRSSAQRQRIMEFVQSLAFDPNCAGDFPEKDDTGRTVRVKIIGRHAVTFWADHAVSEVKITHIQAADS